MGLDPGIDLFLWRTAAGERCGMILTSATIVNEQHLVVMETWFLGT